MQMSTNMIKFLYIVKEVMEREKLTTLQLFSNNDASDKNILKLEIIAIKRKLPCAMSINMLCLINAFQ